MNKVEYFDLAAAWFVLDGFANVIVPNGNI